MRKSVSNILFLVVLLVAVIYLYRGFLRPGKKDVAPPTESRANQFHDNEVPDAASGDIEALTQETAVVPYVKQHNRLPDYYVTKREARQKGWIASAGNLCDVLPGYAIGGDVFSNRERSLPSEPGRIWFEADINFTCGRRTTDRLIYSSDGLVYVTHDHYRSFQQK
jgi:hypothetical protein